MSARNGNGHGPVRWEDIAPIIAPQIGRDVETLNSIQSTVVFHLKEEGRPLTAEAIAAGIARQVDWHPDFLYGLIQMAAEDVKDRREISRGLGDAIIRAAWNQRARRIVEHLDRLPVEEEDEAGPRSVSGGLSIRSGTQLEMAPPVDWLIEPYVPFGRIGGIDGMEGIGKSLFVVWLMVPVLLGGGEVLYVVAEDDPEDILRRLLAAGWDQRSGEVDFFEGDLALPRDIGRLARQVEGHPYRMVALDPGRDYLADPRTGERNRNAEEHMSPGLLALNKLARKKDVAMPFIHHWNRSTEKRPSERYSGAAAYSQKVRHRISMAYVGDEGALAVTKSNIASEGHLRSYRVEDVPEYGTARFVLGDPIPGYTGREALNRWWEDRRNQSAVAFIPEDVLECWCMDHLTPGDLLPTDKKLRADRTLGLSDRQITEAKHTLTAAGILIPGPDGRRRIYQGDGDLGDGNL